MFKRLNLTIGAVAALAALGLAGAAIAGATGSSPAKPPAAVTAPEVTSGPDGDTIQSGDQTTPDTATAKVAHPAAAAASTTETATESPATEAAAESATTESAASEAATPSDGPGGHADAPGNANVEQQGQN